MISSSEKMKSSLSSLKGRSISRIKLDMIQNVLSKTDGKFLIMVIDDSAAKILSSFLSMSDLLNLGIFSVERLLTNRQPYPQYHALYFISPTVESCSKIVEDFANEKKPMYSRAHIFFTHRITDEIFDTLIERPLVRRVPTCKELNLSYMIRDKNLYDFNFKSNMKIFSSMIKKDDKNLYITQVMEKLLTICAVMQQFPNIQYQKSSSVCSKLADILNLELKKLFKNKDRQGILLITDRTLDPASPLLHDYNYGTMVHDLFPFVNKNEINDDEVKGKLDDSDELWELYKDKHLVKVFEQLSEDFDDFMKSDLGKVGKTDNLNNFEDMESCLKNMTGYKEKNRLFSLHLKLAEKVNAKYKELNLNSILDLEQDIVSGVDETGHVISPKDIFKKFSLLKTKLESNNQHNEVLRLLGIILICLDMTEKDFSVLSGGFKTDKEKAIFTNFNDLGISFSSSIKKSQRKGESIPKDNIKKIKQKLSQIEYKILRSAPKIETIVEQCSKYELSKDEFAFVEEPQNLAPVQKYGTKHLFGRNQDADEDNDDEDRQTLLLFTLGGIAYNEIESLINLTKEGRIGYKLVIGSTGIYNAEEYLKDLSEMSAEKLLVGDNNLNNSSISRVSKSVDQTDIELQVNPGKDD